MAGALFGIPLSQQVDETGRPLSGGLLYIYAANTSTPVTTYADFNLLSENPWPLELSSAGRVPVFWVDDGSYRARLTSSTGVEIFDHASITAIGSSSGGGGESLAVDTETVFGTGDMMWKPVAGTRTGWVRSNGRTIGSGSSSATERANADTQALFEYFWNNFSDTLCPVGGGRGASAAADFNANKAIGTLDMRGYGPWGLDDMGNSAAGVITAGTPTSAASSGGAETATIAQANLPNVNLVASSLTGSVGTTITNGTTVIRGTLGNVDDDGNNNKRGVTSGTAASSTLSLASGTVTFGGNVPLGGSGTALNKMPPYRLGTWYVKL